MGIAGDLRPYLQSPDGDVRGLAVRGLLLLGDRMEGKECDFLKQDRHRFKVYTGDGFLTCTVADLVRQGGRERNSLAVTMEPAGPITAGPASEE